MHKKYFKYLIIIILLDLFNFTNAKAKIVKLYSDLDKAIPTKASLIVDINTNKILYSYNAYTPAYPASLTKMMTIYICLEKIEQKKLKLGSLIKISNYASKVEPSKLYLKPGEKISIRDAIKALIVVSANDAAIAIAEHISGSEENFVKLMNIKARNLGLNSTNFMNASGLPNIKQRSNAIDMAKLGIALKRDFKKYYHLFSLTRFKFKNSDYLTKNILTKKYSYVDGIKTGYIFASGFNLVTSASKHNKNLIAVVLGEDSITIRNKKIMHMINKYLKY